MVKYWTILHLSYWLQYLFKSQHVTKALTQPYLSARTACGTGRGGRRRRVAVGDPGTPGLRSDSWQRRRGQRGWHGAGPCQTALTGLLRRKYKKTCKMTEWSKMQMRAAEQQRCRLNLNTKAGERRDFIIQVLIFCLEIKVCWQVCCHARKFKSRCQNFQV